MGASKFRISSVIVLLIALLTCENRALAKECNAPTQVLLTYSAQSSPSTLPLLLCSPDGRIYRVFLEPDFDVQHGVAVLNLVLQPVSSRSENTNLLVVNERWHGYQPFTFAAMDYANGAEHSVFGIQRRIAVRNSEMQLIADMREVKVGADGPDATKFLRLSLQIEIQEIKK
jgi:hypothetical protein